MTSRVRASVVLAVALACAALASCGPREPGEPVPDASPVTDVAANEALRPIDPAPPPPPRERVSRYTSLAVGDCRLLEENREEGGYWRRACPGVDGLRLETSESDLRQNVVVIGSGGRRDSLDLSAKVAKGAFNALGERAEWRGTAGQPADRLIVRLNVARPEANGPDISQLVVARLQPTACAVAVIPPGAEQSGKARLVADGRTTTCL